jgi:hypothetical protein
MEEGSRPDKEDGEDGRVESEKGGEDAVLQFDNKRK